MLIMPQDDSYDLVVIGGGPAGYVGSIRAAQLGMKVVCVERDKLGGVCLNWGCIPTKTLLAGAEFYQKVRHDAASWGIEVDNVRHNWQKVIERSRGVSGNLNKGIHGLFTKNKVSHIDGVARIVRGGPQCAVEIRDASGGEIRTLSTRNILICTGAAPRSLPGAEFDGEKTISFKEAMVLPEQPKSLLVMGAGAIGMEFAYFFNAYGTKVTVIEMLERVLPNEDVDVCTAVARSFKKQGITCLTATRTSLIQVTPDGVQVTAAPADDPAKSQILEADKLLMAIGVKGNFDGLFDSGLGIRIERDHIVVDRADYGTGVDGIYAVGDVIGAPWLAHVASEEAIVCVEIMAGHEATAIDYDSIPGCTYCLPQVASLGRTEDALKAAGMRPGADYKVGKFPFRASGKAQALGTTDGFIKILTDTAHGEILGVHMVGESVTELLAEIGLARRLEASSDEIIATMHAHPTLSEAVHEAALGTEGRMIHFTN